MSYRSSKLISKLARAYTTNPRLQKSAADSAKDTLESVNRTLSDAAVKGIEKGGMSLPLFSLVF